MNKVSICCITYNHGKFIEQALDSFLCQVTKFEFEILVSDDASTDDTIQIIDSISSKHPGRITFLKNEINIGMAQNFGKALRACTGEYIAICEGDDYWCSENKLQKQVDFLEANPDYAICFNNARILKEHDPTDVSFSNNDNQKEVSTFEDLALREFIYTPTCMFRRADFQKFPQQYIKYLNNYTLDLHNAQFGKIKYLNEVMSVYRIHPGGVWSTVRRDQTLINQLPAYKFYLNYFDKTYRQYFINHLKSITNELIEIKIANKDYKKFWKYYIDYARYNFNNINKMKIGLFLVFKVNYHNLLTVTKK